MWLLLITVTTATALTLPKVEVDKAILEKYGVTDDVNQPGYFKKAIDSFNSFRKQYPGAIDPIALWTLVENTAAYSLPVLLSRQWILLGSAAQAQNLVQILVAHLLNVANRFRQTAEAVNLLEFGAIKKLKSGSNVTFIDDCRKDRMVMDLAHKVINAQGTFDPVRTCDQFLQAVRKNSSNLDARTAASMKAHTALDGVEDMVINGDRYTFGQIEEQLKAHPIIDPFMYDYFEKTLRDNLEDYDQVIRDLQEDPSVQQVYDSIAKKLGSVGVVQH